MPRDRFGGEQSAAFDPVIASDSRPWPYRLVDSTPSPVAQIHSRLFGGCEGRREYRLSWGEPDAGLLLQQLHGYGSSVRARSQSSLLAASSDSLQQREHRQTL